MSKKPYLGINPSFNPVTEVGGKKRNCLVVDLLSDHGLSVVQMTYLSELIEALIAKHGASLSITAIDVVTQDRFDRMVADGLRL